MAAGLQRQLGLGDGIVFAFGSVVGAGILFLPSLIYAIAGNDSLIVWIGAISLAFPLLVIMSDMVKRVSDGSGIEGFISLGLGDFAASSVPWLLLTIMFCGGSASAFIAGRFVDLAFGGGQAVVFGVALAMAIASIAIPAAGLSIGRRTQKVITWTTIGVAALVLALTLPETRHHSFTPVVPTATELRPILLGTVAAFFAFVGFENLTFIAGEFKRPERDFFLASLVAFILYTALLLGLSLAFGVLAGARGGFDATAGLVGLAATIGPTLARIMAIFAVFAVLTNITSWVWGMSRMIYKASEAGKLPRVFFSTSDGVPRKAVFLAGGLYVAGLVVLFARPSWAVVFLVITGAVGCMLYLLALGSYLRVGTRRSWKVVAALLLVVIVVNLVGVGWPIVVPILVAAASYGFAAFKRSQAA